MPCKAHETTNSLFSEFIAKWGAASEQKAILLDTEEGSIRGIASQDFLNLLVSPTIALFFVSINQIGYQNELQSIFSRMKKYLPGSWELDQYDKFTE